MEALRLREMEQRELERKFGKKKAKEVAQQKFNVSFFYIYQFTFLIDNLIYLKNYIYIALY